MKTIKILYWLSTSLVVLMMTYSGIAYVTDPKLDAAFQHLGFPAYFRIELAVAKFIGVVFLIFPAKQWLKEWTYAGFTVVLVSAVIAHAATGNPGFVVAVPAVFLALLGLSYFTRRALHSHKASLDQQTVSTGTSPAKTTRDMWL